MYSALRARRFQPVLEQLESRLVPSAQPTATDQLLLEQLNDARANPAAYGASIGLDLSNVAAAQPLAFDTNAIAAAEFHSLDMSSQAYFAHSSPNGDGPGDRLADYGVQWRSFGESIAAGFPNAAEALKGLIVDTGVPDLGHRRHLLAMDATFQSQGLVGIGVVLNGAGPYGNYFTIDTAQTNDTRPYVTGVVYNDANANGKYDVGEGLGNVSVSVAGVGSTVTFGSGGYSLQLTPGSYSVTFSGPGLPGAITRPLVITAGTNVRVNVTPGTASSISVTDSAAFVSEQYQTLLHRTPGQAEINAWTNLLMQGVPQATVTNAFRSSSEFGYQNSAWVRNLYRDLLHREAGGGEVNVWVGALRGGMTANSAAAAMMGSLEYQQTQWAVWVPQAYSTLLNRTPNASEQAAWVRGLQGGMTHEGLLAAIASSQEYASHLSSNTSANWVASVYVDLLQRSAAASEISYWSGVLRAGTSRYNVALQIAQGPESVQLTGVPFTQGLYQNLLGRTAGSGEVNLWVGQLLNGASQNAVEAAILGSAEYYQRALLNP